jgi:hypothetical protein
MVAVWSWLACAPEMVPSSSAVTDDGAFSVDIGASVWPEGAATLPIAVTDLASQTPVIDATVTVVTSMPDMPHDNAPVVATPVDGGGFAADVWFSMQGLWRIDVAMGAFGDEGATAEASLWVSIE